MPVRNHSSSACNAPLTMRCIGPLLTGSPQSNSATVAPSRRASAWAVPAISQRRNESLSGWRAGERIEQPGVALGLGVDDRRLLIGAEDRAARGRASPSNATGFARLRQRHGTGAAAVHEVAVERVRQRRDAVVVRDERGRRL